MFGRKKMYKRGMSDALKANQGFAKKQEDALNRLREEVQNGSRSLEAMLGELSNDLKNDVYDYLNVTERKRLYQLNTPIDIKTIESLEKQLLVSVLFQLAYEEGDCFTENQQQYLCSVQRYLSVTNPQTYDMDLTNVEKIDSIEVQKAFLQVVLEFLYLQDGEEISDAQEDFLSMFSVSKRQAEEIEKCVSRIYNITGAKGLIEKYGGNQRWNPDLSNDDTKIILTELPMLDKKTGEAYLQYTPNSIARLNQQEKELLLLLLYELKENETPITREQRIYLSGIHAYLDFSIENSNLDLDLIRNINELAIQKAMLQCAVEFWMLNTLNDPENIDKQAFLNYFPIGSQEYMQIINSVESLICVVNRSGLSIKYWYWFAKDSTSANSDSESSAVPYAESSTDPGAGSSDVKGSAAKKSAPRLVGYTTLEDLARIENMRKVDPELAAKMEKIAREWRSYSSSLEEMARRELEWDKSWERIQASVPQSRDKESIFKSVARKVRFGAMDAEISARNAIIDLQIKSHHIF